MEILKNDKLTVEISSHGAELQSIKNAEGREYLWQGDAKYWPRRSPLLFPIVCGLWQDEFRVNGKSYKMSRHGFSRDMDFEVVKKSDTEVTFSLSCSEETLKLYPYEFELLVTYTLDENYLTVDWGVENIGKEEMHFQIGGHPAFNLPGIKEGDKMHGAILLDNEEPLNRVKGNVGGCFKPEYSEFKTEDGVWKFDEESFADDAVVFDKAQVDTATILDENGNAYVGIDFNAPAVGLWSPYGKNAPFVCLEPWYGMSDEAGFTGEFKDKYLMNHLQPGAMFLGGYCITVY